MQNERTETPRQGFCGPFNGTNPIPKTNTRPHRDASQKRCVAKCASLRRGFFRYSSLHRTHRATPKGVFSTGFSPSPPLCDYRFFATPVRERSWAPEHPDRSNVAANGGAPASTLSASRLLGFVAGIRTRERRPMLCWPGQGLSWFQGVQGYSDESKNISR